MTIEKKKIGILTFHNSYNYGALLQAYATQQFLENSNYDVRFINYANEYEQKNNKIFSIRKNLSVKQNIIILLKNILFKGYFYCKKSFSKFIKELPKTKKVKRKKLNSIINFDVLIAGSDQIWNPNIYGGKMDTTYLLDFTEKARKISFASSFGSYKLNTSEEKCFKAKLNNFTKISVREEFAIEQLRHLGLNNIEKVCDPTILLSRSQWENIIKNASVENIEKPYIVVYLMSKYEQYENQIKKIADYYNYKIVFITFSDIKRKYVDYYAKGYTPFQFLKLLKNASLVLTNSFHGTVFSLIFNKEFFYLENTNNPKRISSLLNLIKLKNRTIRKDDNVIEILKKNSDINYNEVNEILNTFSNISKKWLIDAIEFNEKDKDNE